MHFITIRLFAMTGLGLIFGLVLGFGAPTANIASAQPARMNYPARMSYAADIEPIFRGWCMSCHQPGGQGYEASGLDLTSYSGLMKGTKFGPMVVPGDPDLSNLLVLIEGRAAPEIRMPLGHRPLPGCLSQFIAQWIAEGARDN